MNGRWRVLVPALLGALSLAAASDPAERLPDPAQEAKARAIFQQIRCVVCQNESIDDSEAPLAHDLRQIVRAQVRQGRSESEIKSFLVARYGQFVLLKPSFSIGNAPLWFLTPVLVLVGGAWLVLRSLKARAPLETPLTAVEEAELATLEGRASVKVSPHRRRRKTTTDDRTVT